MILIWYHGARAIAVGKNTLHTLPPFRLSYPFLSSVTLNSVEIPNFQLRSPYFQRMLPFSKHNQLPLDTLLQVDRLPLLLYTFERFIGEINLLIKATIFKMFLPLTLRIDVGYIM